jgi:hypothetical protein
MFHDLIDNYGYFKTQTYTHILGWQQSSCVFFENVLEHSRKF